MLLLVGAGGSGEVSELQLQLGQLQAELSKAKAEAAESHQANLTLGAELAVLERKQRNQVRLSAVITSSSTCCLGAVTMAVQLACHCSNGAVDEGCAMPAS